MTETIAPASPGLPATTSTPWVSECPPDGMSGLIQCYDDVNKATALIATLMIDQINNNPAVMQAFIQQLNRTGNAVPLLGTTNGTPAVSPQVGQYIQLSGTLDYSSSVASANLNLGILPAGDWDCWLWATFTANINGAQYYLNPLPPGFAANPAASNYSAVWPANAVLFSMQVEALTSADSLIVAATQAAGVAGASGTMTVNFAARRRR